jgi:broad specificity phosphatase PhoE
MGATHIFFIRHGESIDDVARGQYVPCSSPTIEAFRFACGRADSCCSAGSPDSPLTSHGVIQCTRLGAHLAGRAASLGPTPYLFCSDFQQARMTAEAIRDAYLSKDAGPSSTVAPAIELVQLAELREKRFRERGPELSESLSRAKHRGEEEAYTEGEPSEEVNARAKRFLEAVLLPLLEELLPSTTPQCIFIVAHGGIHSHVWLQFIRVLRGLRAQTLFPPGVMRLESVPLDEFLSNAAYHEVVLKTKTLRSEPSSSSQGPATSHDNSLALAAAHVTFSAINCVDHLSGLKKTGGGIGNSRYDKKQRKIDSFFSRSRNPEG